MSTLDYIYYAIDYSNSLYHHGIHGMHWGIRRFQNPDGSWTTEGLKRRRKGAFQKHAEKKLNSQYDKAKKAGQAYEDTTKKEKEYLDKFTKSGETIRALEKERDKALDEMNEYKEKNNMFHPDDDGPMYKNYEDFTQGKIDKKGTALNDAYDKAEEAIRRAEDEQDEYFKKASDLDLKSWEGLKEVVYEETIYNRMADKYVEKYGDFEINDLKIDRKTKTYTDQFIEKAVDDSLEVLSGTMSKDKFNEKYNGTGWRMT